jgi:transposase
LKKYSEAFVGLDTAKRKHAAAIAEGGRAGEVRYLGEIDSSGAAVEKLIGKLAGQYAKLHVCYEAGPTGYGLYRQVKALGHECTVVAPSLIPKKAGERIKTNRRDALALARLLRAGELTSVWAPDAWKAQVRLCARYRRLVAAGKKTPVAIAAIAREMAAFLWAIGRQVEPLT